MLRKSHFLVSCLFLLICSVVLVAQNSTPKIEEFDYRVAINNPGPIKAYSAFMEKLVRDENGESRHVFQLTFVIPAQLEDMLCKTTLKLTAFDQTGKVLGMRVWHKIPQENLVKNKSNGIPIVLSVNPDFSKASRFSLEAGILEIDASAESIVTQATCPGCVGLAVETCGAGKVESVKCGNTKDGSTCEFKCKP